MRGWTVRKYGALKHTPCVKSHLPSGCLLSFCQSLWIPAVPTASAAVAVSAAMGESFPASVPGEWATASSPGREGRGRYSPVDKSRRPRRGRDAQRGETAGGGMSAQQG